MRLLPLFQDLPQLAVARDHLSAEIQTKIHHEAFDFFKVYVSHRFIYCTFAFVVVFFIEVLMREGTLLNFPKVSRSQQNRNCSCVHDIYIVT